ILQQGMPPIHRASFLEGGINIPGARDIWAVTRFWVMHFERPWDEALCASPDPRFSARCYPLGLAAFAPLLWLSGPVSGNHLGRTSGTGPPFDPHHARQYRVDARTLDRIISTEFASCVLFKLKQDGNPV